MVFVTPIFVNPCIIEDVAAGIPAAMDFGLLIFNLFLSGGVVALAISLPDISRPGLVRACQ